MSFVKIIAVSLAIFTIFCFASPNGDAMDTLVPKRIANLPTVSEKLENPKNAFKPVYGSVKSSKVIAYSYFQMRTGFGCYFDWVPTDSAFYPNSVAFDSTADLDKRVQFNEWVDFQEQQQTTLGARADEDLKVLHNNLVYHFSNNEIFNNSTFYVLLKTEIRTEKIYDSNVKEWIVPNPGDSIVTLYIPIILGSHWVEKEGKVELYNYKFFMPEEGEKRFFFGDGFSQQNGDKVLPYKYVFRVSPNIQKYRNQLISLISTRQYNKIDSILQKTFASADSISGLYPFSLNEFEILEIATRHPTNITPFRDKNAPYPDVNKKNYFSHDSLDRVLNTWLRSNDYKKFVDEFQDPFEKGLALAYASANGNYHYSYDEDTTTANIVETYVGKIKDHEKQKYLVDYFWHRQEFKPNYIYFGFLGGVNTYGGDLRKYVGPSFGIGVIFGYGTNTYSIDIGLQSFTFGSNMRKKAEEKSLKGKNAKDYEFAALDIFADFSYKLIHSKHFEFSPYLGPTINMTEITKRKWDDDAPESERRPSLQWSPGFDCGLSASLFTAKSVKDVSDQLHGSMYADGRWGTRIRIGASTQNALDGLDAFGWKPYITIEFTLRAQLGLQWAEFDWSAVEKPQYR